MDNYVSIKINEDFGTMKVPLKCAGTLSLKMLQSLDAGVIGLKYTAENQCQVVRLENDCLHPPAAGWGDQVYECISRKNCSSMKGSPSKKKGTLLPSKTSEIKEELLKSLDEISAEHYPAASKMVTEAMCHIVNLANFYEYKNQTKQQFEMDVARRSLIEITEKVCLANKYPNYLDMPQHERWWIIVNLLDSAPILALKNEIAADPQLTITDFPDHVCSAYKYLTRRIHKYICCDKKVLPVDVDVEMALFGSILVVKRSAIERTLQLLRNNFFTPRHSADTSLVLTTTQDVTTVAASRRTPGSSPKPMRLEYPNAENAENLPDCQRTNAASSRKRISQDQQDQKGTHGAGLQKQTTEHFDGPKKRRRRSKKSKKIDERRRS